MAGSNYATIRRWTFREKLLCQASIEVSLVAAASRHRRAYTCRAKTILRRENRHELDSVDPDNLHWKPASGGNWMTAGQILKHIANACGAGCRGFVTGDWGPPECTKVEDPPPELPTTESFAEDKAIALQMINQAGENDLANKEAATPWAPGVESPLGRHLLQMVQHLDRHKPRLFYYWKLQGQP
jgi:hypothetical protein